MRQLQKTNPQHTLAVRAGAASIYLLVGLIVGIVLAVTALVLQGGQKTNSFAAITFGVTAISATLAASFPSTAMAALAPLANFIWGVLNGAVAPESFTKPAQEAGTINSWLFWLGFAVGCGLLLLWLFA